jgi:signal transduction histidine kinase/ActR/RegA family two-component response regulator
MSTAPARSRPSTRAPVPPAAPATLPCAWLALDASGSITACNDRLGELLEARGALFVGRTFDVLLSASSRVLYQSYLQPLLRLHGNVQELSLTMRTGRGEDLDVLVYGARRNDSSDTVTDLLLAPIRRRRRIEETMLRIKQAADQAPGMIFQLRRGTDGTFRITYVSDAVRRLYGVTPEMVQESSDVLLDRIDPLDRSATLAALQQSAIHSRDWQGRFRVCLPGEATTQWHEMHATPRLLSDGTWIWHGHVADVTRRIEVETELAAQQTAVRVQEERSFMLARVSHELRTPLNGILGFVDLVLNDRQGNLTALQRERLQIARSSGQHLLYLVNQVLDVSQSVGAQAIVDASPVHIGRALQRAIQLVQPQAAHAGVIIEPIQCTEGLWAKAHEPFVHQVLINLLSNAVKYNHRGGLVSVRGECQQGDVVLQVSDTGTGLSMAQQAGLFQPFNRLGAQFGDQPGTGLGLVITKQLVKLMSGDIQVVSAPRQGTTFSVRLPMASCGEKDVEIGEAPVEARPEHFAGDPPTSVHVLSGRVLYVEDNPVNALLMEAIVAQRPGLELRMAADGAGALAMIRTWQPDLLLLDLHLPDMTGFELLAALRALPNLKAAPAVIVSASVGAGDIDKALSGGFVAYWTKPLDIASTLTELDRLLVVVPETVSP